MSKSLVSIIIPTVNSERFLGECLKSVEGQTHSNIEIIIVDNYSTDRTKEIADQYESRVALCNGFRSKARNVGAGLGKGDYILSIDSDMELEPDVVSHCITKMEEGFDALVIPEFSVGEGFWAHCRALEKLCYIQDDLIEAARFFRRDVFEAVGGYDDRLEVGEDWDIHLRLDDASCKIGRVAAFIKHHEGRLGLREAMSKKCYYGKTAWRYRMKHPKEARRQLKPIRPSFVRNWRRLAKDPAHAAGMLCMKICEFGAGWLGSLASVRTESPRRES